MVNTQIKHLINRIKQQDMAAFTTLYAEFKFLILHFSYRLKFEDAAQELTLFFLELIYGINLDRFKDDSSVSLKKYIAAAIRNQYISMSLQNQRYLEMCDAYFEGEIPHFNNLEEQILLYDCLKRLPERQRAVIIYKYIYKYSDKEISGFMNITRQSVNRLKNKALEVLREYVK